MCVLSDCASHEHLCDSTAFLYYFIPGRGGKYCDEYVCMSARVTRKPHGQTSTYLLCMLPMALDHPSFDGIAMWHAMFYGLLVFVPLDQRADGHVMFVVEVLVIIQNIVLVVRSWYKRSVV